GESLAGVPAPVGGKQLVPDLHVLARVRPAALRAGSARVQRRGLRLGTAGPLGVGPPAGAPQGRVPDPAQPGQPHCPDPERLLGLRPHAGPAPPEARQRPRPAAIPLEGTEVMSASTGSGLFPGAAVAEALNELDGVRRRLERQAKTTLPRVTA